MLLPDEGETTDAPLAEVQAPEAIWDRLGKRARTTCGASFHPPKAAPTAVLCRDCYEQRRRDLDGLAETARGHWPEILTHFGIERDHLRDHHGPCPGCGGSDRFRFDNDKDRGTWVCGGGGDTQAGDGFALLSHVHGWSAGDAFSRSPAISGSTSYPTFRRLIRR
ncbi:MAG: hypothetical protein MZV65_42795 [Chromatiales bacterium]|nr:hypothetical protein [Chromatiales bacterium]